MSVQITSTNYNGQSANVTLFSSTGNTIPYTSATAISLGVQTIPFTYSSSTISNEYGIFSCNFTGYSKTCIINQKTPPDGDGNTYNTIRIGNQIWMSENLKTTKYQDGTPLSNTSEVDNGTWAAATESNKYWALVNALAGNTATYGLLYNQYAVLGSTVDGAANNNLCPVGYHAPTSAEFTTLNTFLGSSTAGTQMKSTTLWVSGGNGTNSSGFNGVPPGYRDTDGSWYVFSNYGGFWTTSSGSLWVLYYLNSTFSQFTGSSLYGFSVRCLRN
jgi:uncharacterized protein (TIGR02145 family)